MPTALLAIMLAPKSTQQLSPRLPPLAELVVDAVVGGMLRVAIHSIESLRDHLGQLARGARAYSSGSDQVDRPSVVTGVTMVS